MKKYFIIFLSIECLCSIGCNTEEQIIANDHFYSKKKLEKLIEKQEEISSLIINNYKDTIFPNEFILKFKKLNSLIIDGGFGQAYPLHIDNDKLSSLKDLHSLSIISFLLDSFPTSFSQFDLLTHLQLSEDYLKNIPPDISKFSKLNYLDVWSNYLTGLPESFKELSQLQIFSINFNQLSAIPSVLKDLPNIQEITLQDTFVFQRCLVK